MKRVIIIGGGYGGTMLARKLDRLAEVVLVEPRQAFVHNVAAIRAAVDPELLKRIVLPYDRLLQRGRVLQARVTEISDAGVRLASGEALEGDNIVVATGSTNAKPFKPTTDDTADFGLASAATHEALKAARAVAIVGAGAVGTELAGEIVSAMPGKSVTLISDVPIFPNFPPRLGERLRADLKTVGVCLIERRKAQSLARVDDAFAGPIMLEGGEIIDCDLVIPALGSRPVSDLFAVMPGAALTATGQVIVDPWLRPAGRSNLFAFGDMAATGDLMAIVALAKQVPWLAKTISAVLAGARVEDVPAYKPWRVPPLLVPVGPKHGASVLPISNGLVVGAWLTSLVKGKSLFIPCYRKDFGLQG